MKGRKLFRLISGVFVFFWALSIVLPILPSKVSAASVSISSPANGQEFTGNEFTVSGTADPNAVVAIMKDNRTIAQAVSDGNGSWSTQLTNLPDGKNTLSIKAFKASGFGYFGSTGDGGATVHLNQMRLSDNAINGSAPYPITLSILSVGMIASPVEGIFYLTQPSDDVSPPQKFDDSTPNTPPVTVTSYPANAGAKIGDFSADGTKYYSPNTTLSTVSVVDVATNTITDTINTTTPPITAWRGPNGKVYVSQGGGKILVINPVTNETELVDTTCTGANAFFTSFTFAYDSGYPYFYGYCYGGTTPAIYKFNISDTSLVDTWDLGSAVTSGSLNLDNSKLYVSQSAYIAGPFETKVPVVDTSTGQLIKTIDISHGAVGFFRSPDFRHLYVSTPSSSFDQTGIDVIDMFDDSVTPVATAEPSPLFTAGNTAATVSTANLSVVLGVKTTSGSLANTGAAISTTLILGIFLASLALSYYDYRQHKKPLVAADPGAQHTYTYLHHIKTVSLPLLKYRLSFSLQKSEDHSEISKF